MNRMYYQHRNLVRLIRNKHFKTMLDIGCGEGEKACFFAENLNMKVLAVDSFMGEGSSSTHGAVQRKISEKRLDHLIRLKRVDARSLSLAGETFDVIFAQNSLHHIFPYSVSGGKQTVEFFGELRRHLSNDGCLYICDVGRFNVWEWICRLLHMEKACDLPVCRTIKGVHFKDKTPARMWISQLESAGFYFDSFQYFVPYPLRSLRPFLGNRIGNAFLESNYMIMAKKKEL